MMVEGMKRNPANRDIVFLSDASRSIQNPAKTILMPTFEKISPSFVMILDLIHVIEYLWKAAYAFHKDGSRECEQWVNKYLRMILEGKAGLVASAIKRSATMRGLSENKREIVDDKSADYFKNNKAYMNYHEYLSLGYPIASGVIEGTCKHLVKDRFEISGARWGLDGAESLLKMRAIYQSGNWDEYWEYHIKKEQKRLYSDKQWKPFGEKKKPPKLGIISGGKLSK